MQIQKARFIFCWLKSDVWRTLRYFSTLVRVPSQAVKETFDVGADSYTFGRLFRHWFSGNLNYVKHKMPCQMFHISINCFQCNSNVRSVYLTYLFAYSILTTFKTEPWYFWKFCIHYLFLIVQHKPQPFSWQIVLYSKEFILVDESIPSLNAVWWIYFENPFTISSV